MFVLWTLQEGGIVGGVHLEGGLGGDGGRTAAAPGPGVRMQELTRVIRAVAQAGPVEALMRPVHLLCCVALHEQVHRHDACCLDRMENNETIKKKVRSYSFS